MNEYIKRIATVFAIENSDYLPEELVQGSDRKYSTGYTNKRLNRGLTLDQEKNCPQFIAEIGVSANSPEFTQRAEEFWHEWSYGIPITTYKNNKANNSIIIDGSYRTNADGTLEVKDLNDFILYNYLSKNPLVGKSEEDLLIAESFEYIFIDSVQKEKVDLEKNETRTAITLKLAEVIQREDKISFMKQVLINTKFATASDTYGMSDMSIQNAFFKLSSENSERFLVGIGDDNAEIRSLINEMLQNDVLTQINDIVYNGDSKIGVVKDTIRFFKTTEGNIELQELKHALELKKTRNVVLESDTF